MSAIYQVVNGVTPWDDDDVNQYARAFSNVLGITADNQDPLGRLVLPRDSSDPATPTSGQVIFRSDLGVGGRLRMRHNNSSGIWVPYLPLRQEILASNDILFSSSSLSYVDVTNATVTITTTGGKVLLLLINGVSSGWIILQGNGTLGEAYLKILRDATTVSEDLYEVGAVFGNQSITQHNHIWRDAPSAGSHTYKIQAKVLDAAYLWNITGRKLLVIEYGD